MFIDAGTVSNEDQPADLTITIAWVSPLALGAARLQPAFAVMVDRMTCSDLNPRMDLEDPLAALLANLA